jgi:predicted GNAT family acetyltransferase
MEAVKVKDDARK